MSAITIDPHVEGRLQTERNIWLATTRPNGSPHLAPIWFVWHGGRVYICTEAQSVKVRNLVANPNATAALEDGDAPVVIEGQARLIDRVSEDVVHAFQRKYDWDIATDGQYNQVIEIVPHRIRA